MLIQFLIQDEPELDRWQSGVLTANGKMKPSYAALRIPLAEVSRVGRRTTLWGQVRPGAGARRYRLEQLRNGTWQTVGGTVRTTSAGYFTRVVSAGAGAQFRVVDAATASAAPRSSSSSARPARAYDPGVSASRRQSSQRPCSSRRWPGCRTRRPPPRRSRRSSASRRRS